MLRDDCPARYRQSRWNALKHGGYSVAGIAARRRMHATVQVARAVVMLGVHNHRVRQMAAGRQPRSLSESIAIPHIPAHDLAPLACRRILHWGAIYQKHDDGSNREAAGWVRELMRRAEAYLHTPGVQTQRDATDAPEA